jgi:class 3 adenylate cyclase
VWAPDYPWAPTRESREAFFDVIRRSWGAPIGIEDRAPSRQDDPVFRDWWATYLRMGASPGAALALTRMNADIDVREILGSVRVPTLLLHRIGDRALRVEESRYMATRIPGARLVELPGDDHLPFVGDQDQVLDEIEEFLTGFRPGVEDARVLATVLHGQLTPVAASGPDAHPPERVTAAIERLVERFRGDPCVVDGVDLRAAFDGPVRAIRCAVTVAETVARLGWQLRAGLDIGEVTVREREVEGDAAGRAADVAASARDGEVLVSRPVRDLVAGGGLAFSERDGVRTRDGRHWPTFAVDPASLRSGTAPPP